MKILGAASALGTVGPFCLMAVKVSRRLRVNPYPSALTILVTVARIASSLLLVCIAHLSSTFCSVGQNKSRDREGMTEVRFEAKPQSGLAYCKMALEVWGGWVSALST